MARDVADVVRTLEAWGAGRPLPRTETLALPRVPTEDVLVVTFVRMAGETLPWGVAMGAPGEVPEIEIVLDPRKIDQVARMIAKVAPRLLMHVGHPDFDNAPERAARRQLWLAGASHLEMLSFLDYRFTRAKKAPDALAPQLNAVGRACGWLFREAARAGQVRVVDATSALRAAFAFPADELRQQHLGFLLAWLDARGDRDARQAAARSAERRSVATTLDPALERDELEPHFDELRALRKQGVSERWLEQRAAELTNDVRAIIEPELVRRFDLVVAAYERLQADPRPENPGVGNLLALGAEEHRWQYARTEAKFARPAAGEPAPFVTDPETDRMPAAAAARYFTHIHSSEVAVASLVHGDRGLLSDALARGDGLAGTIAEVRDEGVGRSSLPVWRVRAPLDGALRLREGSGVCVAGLPGRGGRIRAMSVEGPERVVEVVITDGKTNRIEGAERAANDPALEGSAVTLLGIGAPGLSQRKAQRVWSGGGPGSWLTHAAGGPPLAEGGRRRRGRLLRIVEEQETGGER